VIGFRGMVEPVAGVVLERRGLRARVWSRAKRRYIDGWLDLGEPLLLLAAWGTRVQVAPSYRMVDLFELLGRMSPDVLRALEELSNTAIRPFLEQKAHRQPRRRERDPYWALSAVEVCQEVEVNVRGSKRPRRSITTHVACSGVLARSHVSETGHVDRVVALDMTAWPELRNLPLCLAKHGRLREWTWPPRRSERLRMVEHTFDFDLTFGELLDGVLREVCAHGSPGGKVSFADELDRRIDEIDSGKAKLIPASRVLRELRKRLRNGKTKSKRRR